MSSVCEPVTRCYCTVWGRCDETLSPSCPMLPTYTKPNAYGEDTSSYILELALKQLRIKCKRKLKRFLNKYRVLLALVTAGSIVLSLLWLLGKPIDAL